MAQAGQYNFERCLRHGETEAAQLACNEFVNAAMKVFFLMNGRYMPFYKWSFRALRTVEGGGEFADRLSEILLTDHREHDGAERKAELIESVADGITGELQRRVCQRPCDIQALAFTICDVLICIGFVCPETHYRRQAVRLRTEKDSYEQD